MICIYSITNIKDGKRYIGKTSNYKKRIYEHRYAMRNYSYKASNRHLYGACEKHGIDSFKFEVIESFDVLDEVVLSERELYWMDHYDTLNREKGYNLRKDSSSKCVVHEETRELLSRINKGSNNPNYGNKWSVRMKGKMSKDARVRHKEGRYGKEWRAKISEASKEIMKCPDMRKRISEKVSISKRKYDFLQFTKDGEFIAKWDSVKDIVADNPEYKWQNIYSVCNGYKKTYKGFKWTKILKESI